MISCELRVSAKAFANFPLPALQTSGATLLPNLLGQLRPEIPSLALSLIANPGECKFSISTSASESNFGKPLVTVEKVPPFFFVCV